MTRAARRVELPDGLRIWASSAAEAAVLYHELGEESVYSRHGIDVADGNCIFDVGANIGLYSVLLARAYRRLRIFAFEPVAPVYALLERNLALHRQDASIELFDCALGREDGTAQGQLDPGLSFAATLRSEDIARAARPGVGVIELAWALLADLARTGQLPSRWTKPLRCGFGSPFTRVICATAVLAFAVGLRFHAGGGLRKQRFTCQVRTLSGVIHDGRVARIERLLQAQGFSTHVDQEDWAMHPLLGIYTVYARRAE